MKYESEIREILSTSLMLTMPIEEIPLDMDLKMVGMDSISFVRIVIEIENSFGIEFPDEKLIFSEADTIQALCDILVEAIEPG